MIHNMYNAMRSRLFQCIVLPLVAVVGVRMAEVCPAHMQDKGAVPWRERDYIVWWNAHQLFQCEPENLSEEKLQLVMDYNRLLQIMVRVDTQGVASVDNEQLGFAMKTIESVYWIATPPDLSHHAGFDRMLDLCRERLNSIEKRGR